MPGIWLCSVQSATADRPGHTAAGKPGLLGPAFLLLALGGQVGGGGGVREGAALLCPARAAALRAAAAGRDAADHGPKPGPGCCSNVQQLRAAPLRAGADSCPLPLVALARALLLTR